MVTSMDLEELCGVDQLCTGLKAGVEGAIHAMRELYNEKSGLGYGLLLVDARNAFNSFSRVAVLWNTRVQWPRCSRYLFNMFQVLSTVMLDGSSECLFSNKGVIQGDPLSMMFYAVAILPLIHALAYKSKWHQNWYADDSACAAPLPRLLEWSEKLSSLGPEFGYYPEPKKSFLIVDANNEAEANALFGKQGIQIVSGHRFLGGFIWARQSEKQYVRQKLEAWVRSVERIAKAAEFQPQVTYAVFKKSLQFEWSFYSK